MLERDVRSGQTDAPTAVVVGSPIVLPADQLRPNSYNPNVMDAETRQKERLSILTFGFVSPLIVREADGYEIVDGEHRWEIGMELGMTEFPCWNLGPIDDDTAMQLTPILNELHGQPDERKLSVLLKTLMERRPEQELRAIMPFDRARFDELIGEITVDWEALEKKRRELGDGEERWVERVYRLPADAAEVVDQAIAKAKTEADSTNDWQGLEFIAAEFMGR